MPRGRAEELLARWREAERRHDRAEPGTPEFDHTRLEVLALRGDYQRAVDEVAALDLTPQPVAHGID
jgi:hypothetical protein